MGAYRPKISKDLAQLLASAVSEWYQIKNKRSFHKNQGNMSIVNLGLQKKSGGDLVLQGRSIGKKIYGKPEKFPTPPIDQKTFFDQIDELEESQIATFTGGTAETAVRNAKRKVVVKSLNRLALYVEIESDGDVTIIHQAGMQVKSAKTAKHTFLEVPADFKVATKVPGQVSLTWKKVDYAHNYEVMICEDLVAGEWKHVAFNTQARCTVKGLKKQVEYWFRVMALGIEGVNSAWTQPVSMVVQ